MKVLLVGGMSALGKVLIPVLGDETEVITAGRSNCDIHMDLGEVMNPIRLPIGIDVVIHMAAHFGGKTSEEIVEAEKVNVIGTLRLCQASVQTGVKHFVFISSIYSQMHPQSDFYSIYALSKKHAEEAVLFFCNNHQMHLTILRSAQLYGSTNDFGRHQPFLYAIADKAEKGEDIVLNGKNDALRNFLHADDLAQIVLRVVLKTVTGIYSCQFPTNTSISAIAKAAISAFKSTGKVSFLEGKEDIKNNVFLIEDTLYREINVYPRIDIDEGMRMIARNRIQ